MSTLLRLLVFAACLVAIGPLAWHLVSSIKTSEELNRVPPTIAPEGVSLDNYVELFARRPFLRYYRNSFVVATLAALLCLLAAAPAAFALSRASTRRRSSISAGLLLMAFFPPIVYLLPLYEMVRWADLVNHPWALIGPYAALNLPFAIWFLMGYFRQIPKELGEAAALDGLTEEGFFTRMVLPLSTEALLATAVLVFIFSWNEFMFALTFMNLETSKTLTVGLSTLSGAFSVEVPWGLIAAGIVISSAPLIVLIAVFQKRIVAGLAAGALK